MSSDILGNKPVLQDGGIDGLKKPEVPVIENSDSELSGIVQSTSLQAKLTPVLGEYMKIREVSELPESLWSKGYSVYQMDIFDREALLRDEDALSALVPVIGKLIFDVFEDRENPTPFLPENEEFVCDFVQDYLREGDFSFADKVYLFVKDGETKAINIVKYEEHDEIGKVLDLLLTTVEDSTRNTGINKEMLGVLFREEKDVNAFMGVSHTPATVKNRIAVGNIHGFTTYFGGYRDGDESLTLTEDEKRKLEAMMELAHKDVENYDFENFQDGLPPYYVSYGSTGIPPRKLEELNFKDPNSPLAKTFERMVRWQQEHKPDESVYGTVFSIRNNVSPEK